MFCFTTMLIEYYFYFTMTEEFYKQVLLYIQIDDDFSCVSKLCDELNLDSDFIYYTLDYIIYVSNKAFNCKPKNIDWYIYYKMLDVIISEDNKYIEPIINIIKHVYQYTNFENDIHYHVYNYVLELINKFYTLKNIAEDLNINVISNVFDEINYRDAITIYTFDKQKYVRAKQKLRNISVISHTQNKTIVSKSNKVCFSYRFTHMMKYMKSTLSCLILFDDIAYYKNNHKFNRKYEYITSLLNNVTSINDILKFIDNKHFVTQYEYILREYEHAKFFGKNVKMFSKGSFAHRTYELIRLFESYLIVMYKIRTLIEKLIKYLVNSCSYSNIIFPFYNNEYLILRLLDENVIEKNIINFNILYHKIFYMNEEIGGMHKSFTTNLLIKLLMIFENNVPNFLKHNILRMIVNRQYDNYNINEFNEIIKTTFRNFKTFIDINSINHLYETLNKHNFKQRILNNENENLISRIIKNDDVESFISHITENNISLFDTVNISFFDSTEKQLMFIYTRSGYNNEYLMWWYAAYYGAFKIFKYIHNKVHFAMNSNIYMCAIHGNNYELIEYIEELYHEIEHKQKYISLCNSLHRYLIKDYIERCYV